MVKLSALILAATGTSVFCLRIRLSSDSFAQVGGHLGLTLGVLSDSGSLLLAAWMQCSFTELSFRSGPSGLRSSPYSRACNSSIQDAARCAGAFEQPSTPDVGLHGLRQVRKEILFCQHNKSVFKVF